MELRYDISVIGEGRLKRVLRSIEREVRMANRRMLADLQRSMVASMPQIGRGMVQVGGGRAAAGAGARGGGRAPVTAEDRRWRDQLRAWKQIGQVAEREKLREIKAEQRRHQKAMENTAREAAAKERAAQKEIAARARAERRAAEMQMRARVGAVRSMGAGAARTVGRLGAGVAMVGGLMGGISVAGAIEDQIDTTKRASKLANITGDPRIKAELASEAGAPVGFTRGESLGALETFSALSGDLADAREALKFLGPLALATGTDLQEMADAAANAFVPLKDQISDPIQRMKTLRDVMQSVAGMGNIGGVEIKDLAVQMAGLAAQAGKFDGPAADVMKNAVIMAQAARKRGGAGTAAEAVTSVERFGDDLIQNNARFKKMGVNVWANKGRTKLRSQEDIMLDVLEKTGGDQSKIKKGFGIYAARAVSGFAPIYTEAEKRKKGSGRAAVQAEFDTFRRAAVTDEKVNELAGSRMQDADVKFVEAKKSFDKAVGEQLLPEITKLVPELAKLAPDVAKAAKGFAGLVAWFSENPMKGLGAIVAASIGKELAMAGIGAAAEKGITALAAKAGGAGIGAGKAALGATAVAAVGAAVIAGQQMSEENDGASVIDIMGGALESLFKKGDLSGAFDVADKHMNEKARQRAEYEEKYMSGQGAPSTGPADAARSQEDAARKLGDAAGKINSAAEKLASAGGPRSGAPIVARAP